MSHRQDVFTGTTLHPHVIALHCSLSSGHQWVPLIESLGRRSRISTPDISGYGSALLSPITAMTLADEVTLLGSQLAEIGGPVHLIGHSYGAAIAFEMATRSSLASRVSTAQSATEICLQIWWVWHEFEPAQRIGGRFTAVWVFQFPTDPYSRIRSAQGVYVMMPAEEKDAITRLSLSAAKAPIETCGDLVDQTEQKGSILIMLRRMSCA